MQKKRECPSLPFRPSRLFWIASWRISAGEEAPAAAEPVSEQLLPDAPRRAAPDSSLEGGSDLSWLDDIDRMAGDPKHDDVPSAGSGTDLGFDELAFLRSLAASDQSLAEALPFVDESGVTGAPCKHCGTMNEAGSFYCEACGERL